MTIDDRDALIDFHYWARDRVLEAAATLTPEQFDRDLDSCALMDRRSRFRWLTWCSIS